MPTGITRAWRDTKIPAKFSAGLVGLLLLLMAVAASGYLTLRAGREAEAVISRNQEIQRLVLSMDRALQRAKHLQDEFFLNYRFIGIRKAHEEYALPSIKEAAAAVMDSKRLRQHLESAPANAIPRSHRIDLNLYLSSARRFADTSITSYELVTTLALPEKGLESVLRRQCLELRRLLRDNPDLLAKAAQAEATMRNYRLTQKLADLQRAVNLVTEIRNLAAGPDERARRVAALAADITATAKKIGETTERIKSIFNDFRLQEKNLTASGKILMDMAHAEVERGRAMIKDAYAIGLRLNIFMAIAGLCAAVAVVRLLHTSITLRIKRLTGTAQKLRQGDLSVTFDDDSQDELGILAQVFSAMTNQRSADIKKLHEANEALRASHESLERTVAAKTAELRQLLQFSNRLTMTHDLAALFRECTAVTKEIFRFDFSTLLLLSEDKTKLVIRDTIGLPASAIGTVSLVKGQGLSTFVAQHKRPASVLDFRGETRFEVPEVVKAHNLTSALCVPMMIGEDVLGVLIGHTRRRREFTKEETALFQSFANQAAIAIDNAQHIRAIEESEKKFRTFFNNANDAIIIFSMEGAVLEANEVACVQTGFSRQELLAGTLRELTAPDHRPGLPEHLLQVKRQGKHIFESAFHHQDGASVPVEMNCTVFDFNGGPAVLAVVRDISERKLLARELQKIGRLESLGVLAGGIAHDFNNILASIMGNLNLATLDQDLSDETRHLLTEAEKASIRARGLTQQLLTFAKGGAPVKEVAAIADIIRDCADFVLRGSNVSCRYRFDRDLRPAEIDKGQFSQVIQNLVINARHAMPDGGVITITGRNSGPPPAAASTPGRDRFLEIAISDNGIGIPEQIIDKIFDPYFSTKSRSAQKGMGLGLTIAHSIVHQHGGLLWLEPLRPHGLAAHVYLPLDAPFGPGEDRPGCCRALLLDDDDGLRRVARRLFDLLECEVLEATTGEQALVLARDALEQGRAPTLVLLAIDTSRGKDGLTVLPALRTLLPSACFVAVSGDPTQPPMLAPRDHGFDAALEKPFGVDACRRLLDRCRLGGGV